MGFGEIDDLTDGFAIFDISEKGSGGEVPSADDVLALDTVLDLSILLPGLSYLGVVPRPIAAQVLLRVHDQPRSLSKILLEEWIA